MFTVEFILKGHCPDENLNLSYALVQLSKFCIIDCTDLASSTYRELKYWLGEIIEHLVAWNMASL